MPCDDPGCQNRAKFMNKLGIRKAYADTENGQIHYRYISGVGTPLLCFHRNPASSESFEPMMRTMTGTRPLYAFDTPGFGDSFNPADLPSIADYKDWMLEALTDMGITRAHIYGHHTGVHIGTAIAIERPDLVESLTLNGITYWSATTREAFRAKLPMPVAPDENGDYVAQTWKRIRGMFNDYDPVLVHREFASAIRSQRGAYQATHAVLQSDYPSQFAKLTCPLLVMCADGEMVMACFQEVLDAKPEVRSKILAKVQYFSPELDTDNLVAEVNDFLEDVEAAS